MTAIAIREYVVRPRRSVEGLGRSAQLAWAIAELAASQPPVCDEVREMVVNRVIDNAAVAAASLARAPVAAARAQARAHRCDPGSSVFGLQPTESVSPE